MKTIRLTIPNMKSGHCQMTVTNVVKQSGATVKRIFPGQADIEISGETTEALIHEIEKAGYKVTNTATV